MRAGRTLVAGCCPFPVATENLLQEGHPAVRLTHRHQLEPTHIHTKELVRLWASSSIVLHRKASNSLKSIA
eukprot:scaffold311106_cov30-Prasinocladus_malaysianus.AAC.2